MDREADFIARLRPSAISSAARGLADDVALLNGLVITQDALAEGVHFLTQDAPEDVAWKLVAVNLSDLASKGATPLGVLLTYTLSTDAAWDEAFADGLHHALNTFNTALLGGDTISLPRGAPCVFSLTAIGQAGKHTPARSGAQAGDALYVSGTIGDAGLGLRIASSLSGGERTPAEPMAQSLLNAYRRPQPQLAAGALIAPHATAMMDVSDGLLLDAQRMAEASGVRLCIDLDAIPLSDAFQAMAGHGRDARLTAATAGDDYQLLFSAPEGVLEALVDSPTPLTRIGWVEAGGGALVLSDKQGSVALPAHLGWLHKN